MRKPLYAGRTPDDIVALSILPMVRAQAFCFGFFDLLLGVGLYDLHPTKTLIVASSPLSFHLWAIAFALMGILLIYAVIKRRSILLRSLILLEIFVKVTWFVALLLRIADGGTFFTLVIWGLLMALQFTQYLYYFYKPKPLL